MQEAAILPCAPGRFPLHPPTPPAATPKGVGLFVMGSWGAGWHFLTLSQQETLGACARETPLATTHATQEWILLTGQPTQMRCLSLRGTRPRAASLSPELPLTQLENGHPALGVSLCMCTLAQVPHAGCVGAGPAAPASWDALELSTGRHMCVSGSPRCCGQT